MIMRRCDVCGHDIPQDDFYILQIQPSTVLIMSDVNRIEVCRNCVAEIEAYINLMKKKGDSND